MKHLAYNNLDATAALEFANNHESNKDYLLVTPQNDMYSFKSIYELADFCATQTDFKANKTPKENE